jgi:hypothetical protein
MSQTLNKGQLSVLDEVPVSYRATFNRAYSTNSRNAAIRAFCLRCVGYLREDVRNCTAQGCPLWTHRPYQSDLEEEAA